jgi:ABC-2 type transport system permease protein
VRRIAGRTIRLARLETLLFAREPIAVFFSLAFPLLLLAFVGSIYGSQEVTEGVRFIDSYVPIMLGVTAANTGIMGLAIHLAENRSRGVLRRIRLSRIHPLEYFVAQMLCGVVVLLVSMSGLAAFSLIFYGPGQGLRPVEFVLAAVVAMYSMFSVGIFIGGLRLPVRSVQVLGTSVFFFLFFASGAAIPRNEFPDWLRAVSDFNPLTHINEFLAFAYTGTDAPDWTAVLIVIGLSSGLNLMLVRSFDWEGRQ